MLEYLGHYTGSGTHGTVITTLHIALPGRLIARGTCQHGTDQWRAAIVASKESEGEEYPAAFILMAGCGYGTSGGAVQLEPGTYVLVAWGFAALTGVTWNFDLYLES